MSLAGIMEVNYEASRELGRYCINWGQILSKTFTGVTNNYKLIQFQYKLLLRISTCKYMRFKMNIVKDNGRCSLCNGTLETLEHIFLNFPNTKIFIRSLNIFVGNIGISIIITLLPVIT